MYLSKNWMIPPLNDHHKNFRITKNLEENLYLVLYRQLYVKAVMRLSERWYLYNSETIHLIKRKNLYFVLYRKLREKAVMRKSERWCFWISETILFIKRLSMNQVTEPFSYYDVVLYKTFCILEEKTTFKHLIFIHK